MKYIVSSAASLSFADGSRHELTPGIHDNFPEHVKKHWAFTHHAKPLSESDFQQEQQSADLSLRVAALEGEVTDLQKLLELEKDKVTEMTDQRDARDQTIDEHLATIADLQKLLAEKEPVKEPDGEKGPRMPKNSNLPTNDKFREDFPEFADKTRYPDTAVNFYLGQADTILNQDVLSDQFVYLAELFTAHYTELRGRALAGASLGMVNSNGSAGVATSKSVDKVSVSYDVSGVINPDAGFWNNTGYGREFFWWWSMFGAGGRQLL